MEKPNLRLVTPTTEKRTVTPQRASNAHLRTREHLTADEVEKLIETVRQNRYGHRGALMVLLAYRHGLRAAEVVHLSGLQNRNPAHPQGQEWHPGHASPERARNARAPPPSAGKRAITVCVCLGARRPAIGARLLPHERAAIAADLGIKAHAHMLRHACGYKLANDGHDTRAIQAYLGHRNIQNTTRYTALAPQRFKEFLRD